MTSKITIYEPSGKIFSVACCPEGLESLVSNGMDWIRADSYPLTQYVVNGALETIPPCPDPVYTFNYSIGRWEDDRTLSGVQASQWELVKTDRDAAIDAGFTWNSMQFQSDAVSQSRIMGAVQLAQIAIAAGQPFNIVWTLMNNTTVTLRAAEMVNVGLAMGALIQAK